MRYKKEFAILLSFSLLAVSFLGCKEKTNQPPVAVLNVPEYSITGTEIFIDWSQSHDPEGRNINAEIDVTSPSYKSVAVSGQKLILTESGSYRIKLTVTDEIGLINSTLSTISVEPLTVQLVYPKGNNIFAKPAVFTWICNGEEPGKSPAYYVYLNNVLISEDIGIHSTTFSKILNFGTVGDWKVVAKKNGVTAESAVERFTTLPNTAPIINAGEDIAIVQGDEITLSAEANDPENAALIYEWYYNDIQIPPNAVFTFGNTNSFNPVFYAKTPGIYTLHFKANDGEMESDDSIVITVDPLRLWTLSPAGENVPVDSEIQWECNGSSNVYYDVYLDPNHGANLSYIALGIGDKHFKPPKLRHEIKYFCKVVAFHNGCSVESEVWQFTTQQASWGNIGLEDQLVRSIAVDTDPNNFLISKIYAGTKLSGLLKSVNDGLAWEETSLGGTVNEILIRSKDHNIFAATSNEGLQKSSDEGVSWIRIGIPSADNASSIAFNPGDPLSHGMIATTFLQGIFSTSDGTIWNNLYSSTSSSHNAIAFTENNIYITTTTGLIKIPRGTAGGVVECAMPPNIETTACWAICAINGGVICEFENHGLYYTPDGEENWISKNTGLPAEFPITTILKVSEKLLYAGTYGGKIYRTIDGCETWTLYSRDLTESKIWDLAADNVYLYAATSSGVKRAILE